jgi:hypothetical protein
MLGTVDGSIAFADTVLVNIVNNVGAADMTSPQDMNNHQRESLLRYMELGMYSHAKRVIDEVAAERTDSVFRLEHAGLINLLTSLRIQNVRDFLSKFESAEELRQYPQIGDTLIKKVELWLSENPTTYRTRP